ncbi:hypothetical protein ABID21_002715 [Pseudorhizobium tarimense]|uniref:DUF1648 domain-containing protein n=1 Tax=Pseudorhizobium tarimense TaxID=1079109 RepID=A0ABV2H8R7_9HYPH|nr:DUF1648 domain-containing protein [Pseudorhizobium tarimense]MCJ8519565.1 DUF1648 domain-containing protein [Pseudorhizobium tarimense]
MPRIVFGGTDIIANVVMGGFKTTKSRQVQVSRCRRLLSAAWRVGNLAIHGNLGTPVLKLALPITFSSALIAAMVAATLAAWEAIPSDLPIAIHFGIDGTPNGYASKPIALWTMPVAALLSASLFVLSAKRDPKAAASRSFISLWLLISTVLATGHGVIVLHAMAHAG